MGEKVQWLTKSLGLGSALIEKNMRKKGVRLKEKKP
jgi:hypothetical protein